MHLFNLDDSRKQKEGSSTDSIRTAELPHMKDLVERLNKAADSYYNDGYELMSNYEYDSLLDELRSLESKTGIVLEDSPSNKVGYPVKVDKLEKVTHKFPAKSLDKTKDVDTFVSTFSHYGDERDLVDLMWKMDGCTVQLAYHAGKLQVAATRGDGYIGQNITHNANVINGIPMEVPDKSDFTVRGEAVMSYAKFDEINESSDVKYKNPRNLASATITMLDSREVEKRDIHFVMFELVDHPDIAKMDFHTRVVDFANKNGFEPVRTKLCVATRCRANVPYLKDAIEGDDFDPHQYEYPVDGLVCAFNDTSVTDSLKGTEHHPNPLKGYALKWQDESKTTTIRNIDWSTSRTGLLNPVAVFDPIEIDGTTVTRASLHNFSVMQSLHIRIGDRVKVIKANMIIPQIVENLEDDELYDENDVNSLIGYCPSCGRKGQIEVSENGIESVYCKNPSCPAKTVDRLIHFCARDGMDIEGLSSKTITKFVDLGLIVTFDNVYELGRHKSQIVSLDGFGEKSFDSIMSGIEKSKHTTVAKLLSALGIPQIGTKQAKSIACHFGDDINKFLNSKSYDFTQIDGFGDKMSHAVNEWLSDSEKVDEAKRVVSYLRFEETSPAGNVLSGKTFVITGKLNRYQNRKELESLIENNGGKVSSSVTSKTSYLINNDINSTSSKNKKAKELEIPVISEDQFAQMLV